MTKKQTTKSNALTKPAIIDDGLELIDDTGIVNAMAQQWDIETQHLNETAKRFLYLLKRYSDKTEAQVVADIVNAFVEEHLRGKQSRSQMLVEDAIDQLSIEKTRIEKEMKAEVQRVAEQKSKELDDISISLKHFAG